MHVLYNLLEDRIQQVFSHFRSQYEVVNFGDDEFSPYQSENFIELAFAVYKNPRTRSHDEQQSVAEKLLKGLGTMQAEADINRNSEIFFSEVTTQTKLDMIFENLTNLPKLMLIEGTAGIGKTVVAKEIARRWAKNTITLFKGIQLLLLICFREINFNQISTFQQLLQLYYEDKDVAKEVAEHFVKTRGKNLVIIFDGYDELAVEDEQTSEEQQATTIQQKSCTFFKNLLKRRLLPECHLIVTSRPHITVYLHQYCNCRIEIMGFTKENRLSCLRDNLSRQELKAVNKFFKDNLVIDSLCYIPINLINFLSLVKYKEELPKTQTELTERTIRLTIAKNIIKKKKGVATKRIPDLKDEEIDITIKSIANFAYTMLEKQKLMFSETEARIHDDKYGLLRAVELYDINKGKKSKVYSFVHFSVQEYLAAFYLSTRYDITQTFALKYKFWDGKYFGVWRMYTGITKGDNFSLQTFLSGESYLLASLRDFFNLKRPGIHKSFMNNKVKLLQLFQIFQEAPESNLKDNFSTVVNKCAINLSEEQLSTLDTSILSYFIDRSYITKEWKSINISSCHMDDDKLQNFYQGLCSGDIQGKRMIIKYLDISKNNVCKLNTLVKLITKCKMIVYLNASNILCASKSQTVDVDDYCNKTLIKLDLSGNCLKNGCVNELCKALINCKSLEELILNNNEMDDDAESLIIEAIVQWNKLKVFECKGNAFSDFDYVNNRFKYIIKHHLEFNRAEETTLDCNGKVENIGHFISMLIYTTNVPVEQSDYIKCISSLSRLSLDCVNSDKRTSLTEIASKYFQKQFLFKVLKELNLSGLVISKKCFHIMEFSKLQVLKLNSCELTSNDAEVIAHKIQLSRCTEELQLCSNHINDNATQHLIIAFLHCNSFQTFKFKGNQFNKDSELLFEFLLTHLEFSSSSIDFGDNWPHLTSFITLIGYMKGVPPNKSKYVRNISKVHTLNLSCLDQQSAGKQLQLQENSSKGFQIFCNLVSLNISGIIINENAAKWLVKTFENNQQLEELFMNKCQITNPIMKMFCPQLQHISLKGFEIMENCIDDKVIEELAMAIVHWNLLESIKLPKDKLSRQGMLLLKMLTEDVESLSTIDFTNNHHAVKAFIEVLGYASIPCYHGGERVMKFLNNLSEITKLSLEVKSSLELAFKKSTTLNNGIKSMTSLNVSGIIITEQVAANLCTFFDINQKSLKCLIMNDCKLNSIKISKFVHKLRLTVEVKEAQFCNNEIDDDVTESLITAILHWNKLQALQLKNNCFKEEGRSMKIFEMVKEFSKFYDKSINFNNKVDKVITFITLLGYMTKVEINNCAIVKDVSLVEKLSLDCTGQNSTNVQFEVNASRFFTRFVNLTELNISGIEVTKQVASDLAMAFEGKLCSLERLIMNNCKLTFHIIHNVIVQLQKCLKLTELQLSNNSIDDTAVKVIVVAIFHWEYFEVFKFIGNQFSLENETLFEFLLLYLKFSNHSLNLSGKWHHVTSFVTLLGYMKEVPPNKSKYVGNISKVHTLNLSCLDQQSAGKQLQLQENSSKGFQIFSNLVSLNISGIIINENAAKWLVKTFENNRQLEELFMNKCQITNPIMKMFCPKLQHISLKVFEIMENCIDNEVIEELAMTIVHWNLLESLKLPKDKLSRQGMLLLKMLTEDVESLSTIDFMNNQYVVKAFIEVLDYASKHAGERVTQFLNNLSKITQSSIEVQPYVELTLGASHTLNTAIRNMTSLNVTGIIITEQVAANLCTFFDINQNSLKCLIMNDCKLNSVKMSKFVHKLKLTLEIKEAQFCNNEIDDDVTESLVIAILHWNKLQTIELINNCFKEERKTMKIFEMLKEFSKFHDKSISFNNEVDKVITFITLLGYMTKVEINNCAIVKDVSLVEKLSLDCTEQNNTNVQFEVNASRFFTRFVNLTELNISGIEVTKQVASDLAMAFEGKLCSLERLIMNNCKLTFHIIHNVIVQLQKCVKLTELKLSNNNIDDTAVKVIVVAIFHWEYFEVFEFMGNQFSEENETLFEFLLSHLKFSSSSIDFSGNWPHLTSFITLLGYMKEVPPNESKYVRNISKVHTLHLSCLDQQSASAQLQLQENSSEGFQIFSNLALLNISGIIINENAAKWLVKTFENNRQLEELFMNKCQITNPIMKMFCPKLQHISLKVFEIMENCIDSKVIEELAMTIVHWNLLESLKLPKDKLSRQGMLLLKMLTEDVESLSTIDFTNNQYVVKAFIEVLDYASKHAGERVTQFLNNLSKITQSSIEVEPYLELTLNASNTLNMAIRNITLFNISGIIITEEIAANLCTFFDINQNSLKHLKMNSCKLTSIKISKFVYKLKLIIGIKEVQFCNNELDDNVTESLVITILHWNEIETLELENNCFKEEERSMQVFEMVKEFSMFHDKSISFNNEVDKVITFIILLGYMTKVEINNCAIVKDVSLVEKLSLDCTEQTNTNVQFEVNASRFFTRFVNLTELNVSGIAISKEVADNLAEAFDGSLSLECLFYE